MKRDIDSVKKQIKMAKGNIKVELVIKGGNVFNVFTGELERKNLAISHGKIIGLGDYQGEKEIDIQGKTIIPGFIDGHFHIESSMLSPKVLANTFLKCGTTSAVADPHEIANVLGVKGIEYMLNEKENEECEIFFMFPSCVPATSHETSGAKLTSVDVEKLINYPRIIGLGEVMDFVGIENANEDLIKKILLTEGAEKQVDGHSPGIKEKDLNAYIISGIKSDHECSTVEEMREKISCGMNILIREGTAAKNLEKLVDGIDEYTYRFCMFCTDDRDAETLINHGQINDVVKKAIKLGVTPEKAIIMGTLNTAKFYNLKGKGAIAPGYDADFLIIDSINNLEILAVYKKGKRIEKNQRTPIEVSNIGNSINIKAFKKEMLDLKIKGEDVNVISIIPKELFTKHVVRKIKNETGIFQGEINPNISQISVVERHHNTGRVGNGLIENYGIKKGAIATTVAHDSHNIIVIGDNTEDMYIAIKELERIGGGVTLVREGKVIYKMELEIAGLMSRKDIATVSEENKKILELSFNELGINSEIEPLMTLNFMALPVIPELKITDLGMFSVLDNKFIKVDEVK